MKSKEIKLGAFVVGALTIFIIAIFSINDFTSFHGYTIKAMFNFGDGIKPAAPVRVSGVDVGEVKKIKIIEDEGKTKVLIYAWIRQGVKIPVGSQVFVNNLSILGQKYLEILPKANPERYLEEGDTIIGNDSVPIYKIGEYARTILIRFDKLLKSITDVVGDEDVAATFKQFMGNLQGASSSLEGLLTDVRDQRGTLGKLLYEDSIYEELEEFIADIKAHPWKLLHKPKGE